MSDDRTTALQILRVRRDKLKDKLSDLQNEEHMRSEMLRSTKAHIREQQEQLDDVVLAIGILTEHSNADADKVQ